jgi:hypothetical protein
VQGTGNKKSKITNNKLQIANNIQIQNSKHPLALILSPKGRGEFGVWVI